MASVLEIASKINKNWKENVLVDGNFTKEIKRLHIGSIAADYPLYGGLPYGQLIVFSGVEHSGKTTAAALCMAQYQKENTDRVCIWVDAENTLLTQGEFLQRMTGLNLNSDNFLRYDCSGKAAEEIFADLIKLEEADNIGMIVVDSAPALISKADLDNDFEKDNGQRASIAKSLGKFIKQMLMYLPKRENILLIINQVRVDGITFQGAKIYSEPCGYALNYYPSMKVRFGTRTYTSGDKTDLAASKSEGADGFRLKFSITKNRLGPIDRGGGFLTFRLQGGLDRLYDMLEVALRYEFIKRPTLQSYVLVNLDTGEPYTDEYGNELRFVGKQKLIDYVNTNDDFRKKYFDMLDKHISESSIKLNLLDKNTMNEILIQEASINKEDIKVETDDDISE